MTLTNLLLDGVYVLCISGIEPVMLKYWEHGWAVLQNPSGKVWQCPIWLFQKVYELQSNQPA